jgi:hypothetical protein
MALFYTNKSVILDNSSEEFSRKENVEVVIY